MKHLIKAFSHCTSQEKYKLFLILIFSFTTALLEMIGIALVLPVLSILLSNDIENVKLVFFNFDLNFLKNFFNGNILFNGLFLLVSAFFIKNASLIIFNFYYNKFSNDIAQRLSAAIFIKYLKKNFSFYLENNSNELLKNCIYVIDRFREIVNNIIITLSETIVLIGITLILVIYEPKGFLISLVFLGAIGTIVFLASGKINAKWGKEIINLEKERYLHLSQAFSGIREIKVFDKVNFFFNKFLKPNIRRFKISYLHFWASSLPKYIIEVFFILTLAFLLVFFKFSGKTNYEIVTIMGLFAVASLRIMPSLNRILHSYQRIKFGQVSVDILHNELNESKFPEESKDFSFQTEKNSKQDYLIKFENISYKYNSGKKYIFDNINLNIKKNEFFVIIGKTVSGKSTLINLILGLLKPTKGEMFLNFSKIGFVPQSPYLIDDTILNNVAMGVDKNKIDINLVNKCLQDVQLREFVDSLPMGINTYVGEKGARVSGGELQRLAIASALYIKPDVIIFDEATTSLDKATEKKIIEIIKILCRKISIILVTHDPNHLKYCDQILKLENNQIHFLKNEEKKLPS